MHRLRHFALHVLLLVIAHAPLPSAAVDTLRPGQALAGWKKLVSANGKFALGFFQLQPGSSYYLGIWFDEVPVLTPVWTANRDNPVSNSTSPELTISGDGNMAVVLAESGTTTVWSTSTEANATSNDTVAVLLDSGNLVLRSSSNSSLVFWESFDYPTDTQLPGVKIGWDKVTGLDRRLVSRKNSVDLSSGLYSSTMGHDGVARMLWNSSAVYWSSTWTGGFFSAIPEMSAGSPLANFTFVDNAREVYFTYNIFDESTVIRTTLHVSGRNQVRVWTGQDWMTVNNQPAHQCDAYAVCGPFTVCTDSASDADPSCDCMRGFSVRSPAEWAVKDRTGGCVRNTPLNCAADGRNRTGVPADKFYSMPGVRLPQNGRQSMPNASSAIECAQACLSSNCSCTAYSYGGEDGCSLWHGELVNVAADGNEGMIYLRLAAKELESGKGNRIAMVAGVAALVLVLVVVVVICSRRNNGKWWSRPIADSDKGGSVVGIATFKYADLQDATKKFSEKLGAGGFGCVFKGRLAGDSTDIAVKRLDGALGNVQGEKQFRAEVNSVGFIQHINLVKLIGFCCEGDRSLLVYEHMPNGSLDSHLFQSCRRRAALDWSTRYQIALGVARGLGYLHHGCRDCIIHCDIKPQNILLDASFAPKIADFGMAKFLGREFSRVVTTMRGTVGYLAPEWISGTPVTPKVDVYSYGMVLLELVSGKRNYVEHSSSRAEGQGDYLPVQAAHKLLHGDVLSVVDADLQGELNVEEAERVCRVACWCIQDLESDRPTMIEVVQFLEGICQVEIPPMPRLLTAIAGSGSHQTRVSSL
ncbi:G-type lectin S-receptor-like serine/threonine-protein kinase At2g19130 [Zea mays]|uniref:Receptor-like serine/threonine-protein kinase n=1 Tax=Zea mays TaxID=4577 RepID=A0A1D6J6V6_MAIZE|nr:G-type lectin S-receptor-like serine/threonine-protein kinase At2g19130 [Zea mays]AQK43656.1 Putative S-locus receptor-like protein kinase family protein [Zea mays]|eukprot:XP_020400852.1 G-type lectin S-receptor-like serine/threonine-protein kinase At2g19130 [Zea mays]